MGNITRYLFYQILDEAYNLLQQKGHIQIGAIMNQNAPYLLCIQKNGQDQYALIYDHLGLVIRKNKKQIYNQFQPNKYIRSRFFIQNPGKYFQLEFLDEYDRNEEMKNYIQWANQNL